MNEEFKIPYQDLTDININNLIVERNTLIQENKQLKESYDRIYNENCKLREEHNITDISLLDENYKLKNNWNKLKEFIKKSLEAIDTIQKLTGNAIENYTPRILTYEQIKDKMQELQGSDSNE